jgi:hypothetical protein
LKLKVEHHGRYIEASGRVASLIGWLLEHSAEINDADLPLEIEVYAKGTSALTVKLMRMFSVPVEKPLAR